jgi:outer membrane receptor protein involved in Fe transport
MYFFRKFSLHLLSKVHIDQKIHFFTMHLNIKTTVLFLILTASIFASAQQRSGTYEANKTMQGFVIDSLSGYPLEFASVAAFRMRDSSLVSGAITNSKGLFSISRLTPGKYMLRVTFVGYKTTEYGPYTVSPQSESLDVGKIFISVSAASLDAVEIVGERPFIEMNLDKKVVNIEGNVTITGGNALDVLETVPSVNVDMDGNVSYRGSENVTILIDGRPANFGGSRKAVLEQIPADMIESIELITNPSAKYDPEGTTGIINIVLKSKRGQNTSVTTSLNYTSNDGYSGNIAVHQGMKKFNVYGSYDYRDRKRLSEGTVRRISYDMPVFLQEQISESESRSIGHSFRLGADYFINSKNTIGFMINANMFNSESGSFSKNEEKDKGLMFLNNYRNDNSGDNSHSMMSGNLYYTKKFNKPSQELMLDLNYSQGNFDSYSEQIKTYYTEDWQLIDMIAPYLENIYAESLSSTFLGKLDYVHPVLEKFKLETGTHVTMRNMESLNDYYSGTGSSSELLFDTTRSNAFTFSEDVFAAYVNFSGQIDKWGFSAGLRSEYAKAQPAVKGDTTSYLNDYFSLYPTAAISRKIQEGEEIQLTYSKRVNRPSFHSLSPFIDYSNSPNLRGGNPFLKPEYIHSLELGYMKLWTNTSLMPSIFYKRTVDLISRYRVTYLDTFSLATYENIASADAFGFEIILNQTITKWWKLNLSGSLFRTIINGENIDPDLTNDDLSYSGNINSNIRINSKISFQTNLMYRGPRVMPQGRRKEMVFVNAGLRYTAIQNKLTFNLNVRDVFNTMKFGVRLEDPTFVFIVDRKWQSRVATFGLTWQINPKNGSAERRRSRNDDTMQDDDMF